MTQRPELTAIIESLPRAERGTPVDDILTVLDRLEEAGFAIEIYNLPDRRVYRATDPETGERQQVATVPGAVTDWRAVTGVAKLLGV